MAQADSEDRSTDDDGSYAGSKQVSVSYSEQMEELVEDQLEYGDTKSGFVRKALREKLERDGLIDPENTQN